MHLSWIDIFVLVSGAVGVVATAPLVYLAVRLSVYHSDEFDEWTDGILYGTAAGLGYATILNIDFIVSSGGADLGPGTVRVASCSRRTTAPRRSPTRSPSARAC